MLGWMWGAVAVKETPNFISNYYDDENKINYFSINHCQVCKPTHQHTHTMENPLNGNLYYGDYCLIGTQTVKLSDTKCKEWTFVCSRWKHNTFTYADTKQGTNNKRQLFIKRNETLPCFFFLLLLGNVICVQWSLIENESPLLYLHDIYCMLNFSKWTIQNIYINSCADPSIKKLYIIINSVLFKGNYVISGKIINTFVLLMK